MGDSEFSRYHSNKKNYQFSSPDSYHQKIYGKPEYSSYSSSSYKGGQNYNRTGNGSHYDSRHYPGDVEVSKEIVRIVRHGKYREIKMDHEGYVKIDDILNNNRFKNVCGIVSLEQVQFIVENNDKKRFKLEQRGSDYFIKATQGHSVKVESLDLTPISNPDNYPNVLHGTYEDAWMDIQYNGLKRMNRIHIHFAIGLPDDPNVISGMPKSSEIAIEIDIKKAMQDGLKFYISSNGVVLSEGDKNGTIHPKYFRHVMQMYPLRQISFEVPPDFDSKADSSKQNKSNLSDESLQEISVNKTSQIIKQSESSISQPIKAISNKVDQAVLTTEIVADLEKKGDRRELLAGVQLDDDQTKNLDTKERKHKKAKVEEEPSPKPDVIEPEFVLPSFYDQSASKSTSKKKQIKSKKNANNKHFQVSIEKKDKDRSDNYFEPAASNLIVKSSEKEDPNWETAKSKKRNASKQKLPTDPNAEGSSSQDSQQDVYQNPLTDVAMPLKEKKSKKKREIVNESDSSVGDSLNKPVVQRKDAVLTSQQYKLFFSRHKSKLLLILNNDRSKGDSYCDIRIKVNGHEYPAHKCVLGNLSEFFDRMFKTKMKERYDSTVTLNAIDPVVMETVLDFMYSATVQLNQENVMKILVAADYFQIDELKRCCVEFLGESLNKTNCLDIHMSSQMFNCPTLSDTAETLAARSFEEVIHQLQFKELSKKEAMKFLSSRDQKAFGSKEVYEGVLSWIYYDIENRRNDFDELFKLVKLHLLPTDYLEEEIFSQELFQKSHECKDYFQKELLYRLKLPNFQTKISTEKSVPGLLQQVSFQPSESSSAPNKEQSKRTKKYEQRRDCTPINGFYSKRSVSRSLSPDLPSTSYQADTTDSANNEKFSRELVRILRH